MSVELPKIIFAALDADIARELEPKFAAAGCAVISNSSAFRMVADVPLVMPEVNADHLALIETQSWRKENGGKGGYIVTNPNCSAIGLVLALKPLEERFGIESVFVRTMQAISGAGYPGVASLDILGNVVPFIKNEEEKMQEEAGKLLGLLSGEQDRDAGCEGERALQSRGRRGWAYGVREHQAAEEGDAGGDSGGVERVCSAARAASADGSGAAGGV